jgi:hypothetical protein
VAAFLKVRHEDHAIPDEMLDASDADGVAALCGVCSRVPDIETPSVRVAYNRDATLTWNVYSAGLAVWAPSLFMGVVMWLQKRGHTTREIIPMVRWRAESAPCSVTGPAVRRVGVFE